MWHPIQSRAVNKRTCNSWAHLTAPSGYMYGWTSMKLTQFTNTVTSLLRVWRSRLQVNQKLMTALQRFILKMYIIILFCYNSCIFNLSAIPHRPQNWTYFIKQLNRIISYVLCPCSCWCSLDTPSSILLLILHCLFSSPSDSLWIFCVRRHLFICISLAKQLTATCQRAYCTSSIHYAASLSVFVIEHIRMYHNVSD